MFTFSVRRAAHLAAVADLLLLLLAGAAPASGQGAVPVDLALFVGLMDPRGAVPHAPMLAATGNAISYDDMGALGTLGFEVSVRSRMLPASLRLSAERSFDGHELGRWGCPPPVDGAPAVCPDILILVATDLTVTTAAADLVGHLPLGAILLQPMAGLGWVRYRYRWDPEAVGPFSLEPGEATRDAAAVRIGLRASLDAEPARLNAEYGELFSPDDDRNARPNRVRSLRLGVSVAVAG